MGNSEKKPREVSGEEMDRRQAEADARLEKWLLERETLNVLTEIIGPVLRMPGRSRVTELMNNWRPGNRCCSRFPLVYVCSRYRADNPEEQAEHVRMAKAFSEFVLSEKGIPLAPHLLYPRFLNDSEEDDRMLGMICCMELLHRCDELWVYLEDEISEGMMEEIHEAIGRGLPVRWFIFRDGEFTEVAMLGCKL